MAIGATSSSQPSDLEARFERLKMDNRKSLPLDPPIYNRLAPLGPREMPQLPKVDTAPSFPRPPSPTYSPINPPKSISRKPVATAPPTITSEMTVSADALYTYLQRTSEISLLLLDVRSREGFDEGHIYHRSIVCVEPITLRDG